MVGDERGSLVRRSLLVAGCCLLADTAGLLLTQGAAVLHIPLLFAALVSVVVADAALATKARWSGSVALLAAAVQLFGGVVNGQPYLNEAGLLISAYRAGAWLRGAQAAGVLGVTLTLLLLTEVLQGRATDPLVVVKLLYHAVLPWLVGQYTTDRRAYLDRLAARDADARRTAREAVQAAITAERTAIAHDLHDVIAHHVSGITAHAGVARLSLNDNPAHAAESIRAVETAGRAALTDLRHLLDMLHGQDSDGTRQPGLANAEELFDRVRAAGVEVRYQVSGEPHPIDQALDVALYRITQEMLTNALRHGDGRAVRVRLTYTPDALTLTAENGLRPGAGSADGGRGLAGIRNRAGMFGGRAEAGPLPGGGGWRTAVTVGRPTVGQPA